MQQAQISQPRKRRTHDVQLKAAVIAACREPGASVAAVAQANGLNANLVRQWLVGRGMKRCGVEQRAACVPTQARAPMQFVPVQLPAPVPQPTPAKPDRGGQADEAIHIELTRSGAKLTVRWPAAQASACAGWLGELAQVLSR